MHNRIFVLLISAFALIAIASRLMPHEPNLTAVGAFALFAGFLLSRRWAVVAPLLVLLASDFFVGGYELPVMFSVYGSMAAVALIASSLKRWSIRLLAGPVIASTLFFLVTNAVVWVATPWYDKSIAGLMTSYTLALPFWRNMFLGDVVYTAAFALCVAIVAVAMRSFSRKCAVVITAA